MQSINKQDQLSQSEINRLAVRRPTTRLEFLKDKLMRINNAFIEARYLGRTANVSQLTKNELTELLALEGRTDEWRKCEFCAEEKQ